jgi:hypothetical protein
VAAAASGSRGSADENVADILAARQANGKISEIIRGNTEVKHLDKFEEIANGLKFPDSARMTLGIAPCKQARQPAGRSRLTKFHRDKIPGHCGRCLQTLPNCAMR